MAFKCVSNKWNNALKAPVKKFIMDSEADVPNLPKCSPSSVAIVAEGGKAYTVNASGQWVPCGTASYSLAEGVSF